ncbi:MAG: hypothetical protein RJA49_899 [Actinomycetota bacterium]|jgi:hypothetical protein
MDTLATARQMRCRAGALRALARRIHQLRAVTLPTGAGTDTWVGPSQFHCEQALQAHRSALLGHAMDLEIRARRIERAAEQLEATARSARR